MKRKENNTFELTRKELAYIIANTDTNIAQTLHQELADPDDPNSPTRYNLLFNDILQDYENWNEIWKICDEITWELLYAIA